MLLYGIYRVGSDTSVSDIFYRFSSPTSKLWLDNSWTIAHLPFFGFYFVVKVANSGERPTENDNMLTTIDDESTHHDWEITKENFLVLISPVSRSNGRLRKNWKLE